MAFLEPRGPHRRGGDWYASTTWEYRHTIVETEGSRTSFTVTWAEPEGEGGYAFAPAGWSDDLAAARSRRALTEGLGEACLTCLPEGSRVVLGERSNESPLRPRRS